MAGPARNLSAAEEAPLLSNRFLYRLAAVIAVLALLTVAISVGGHLFGQRIALAGHIDSREEFPIQIGQDKLKLPANTIRFRDQRQAGVTERVDLYLTWPELEGYSAGLRSRFDDVAQSSSLIFLQLSQSTMSRDMSGRLEPIYSKLFDGAPQQAAFGLTLHRLRADSGYGSEVVLTGQVGGAPDYAVRCVLPTPGDKATSGDCQRDIHIGQDLTVLYRFSSVLLRDWQHIDAAVRLFVENRLVK
ncbi:hypothetical protein [Neorhizobium galegae]|uniref:Putative transmembrane anchored protein n=1 Tax=Neorhizobium galegae bv. orientalis str. HAMBI 540 TaxID=1028800 RepID=A0A068SQK9_NEOGA|nr:hypothetical protein [Neorhizobium galegae]CDN48046.1 Putative transmembrane anchored protein [Neorhizobium galegae bv. orientalis str. HAMBI 540]